MQRPNLSGTWGHVSQPGNLSGGSVRPSLSPIVKEKVSSQKSSPSKTKPVAVKEMCAPELNSAEDRYLKDVTGACMSSNKDNRAKGLKNLSLTGGIQKLVPEIASFIVTGVEHCKNDNLSALFHLVDMTTSLIENKALDLEGSILDLISAIGTCVVSSEIPVLSPEGDHWKLRNVASQLNGQICQSYNTDANNLTERVAGCYDDYLKQENVALNSFYGGIVGMKELGPSVVQTWIIPNVKFLAEKIDHAKGSSTEINEAGRIRGLLIQTIEPILKSLKHPPELGSLRPYFQHPAGDSSFQVVRETSFTSSNLNRSRNSSVSSIQNKTLHTNAQSLAEERPIDVSSNQNNASPIAVQSVAEERIVDSSIRNNASPTTPLHNMTDPGLAAEVHVYGTKRWWDERIIRYQFRNCGNILAIFLADFYCHIKFSSVEEALECIEKMNGQTILSRKLEVKQATTSKCNVVSNTYYVYCEKFNICNNYNISDNGCIRDRCPRRHICLYCHELLGLTEPHSSRFSCPEKRDGYVHYPPRENLSQPTARGDQVPTPLH